MEIFKESKFVSEVYEVCGEWEVWIGSKAVKVRVSKDSRGKYHYNTSHYYHGSEQAGPYISSYNGLETKEGALHAAKRQILSFYNPDDDEAIWVRNENY